MHANLRRILAVLKYRHTSFYCVLLHCALQTLCFLGTNKFCGNSGLSKSIGAIFLIAFVHFMSVSHFGNSHILNFFIIITFVRVISDYKLLKAHMMVSIF